MIVTATNHEKTRLDGQLLFGGGTAVALYFDPLVDAPAAATGTCPPIVLPNVQVEVRLEGAASGRVVSDPPGIDCPGQCTASFDALTTVELTATAGPDGRFDGWGEPCTRARGPCRFEAAERTVVARFEPPALAWQRTFEPPVGQAGPAIRRLAANAGGQVVAVLALDGSGPVEVAAGVTWQGTGLGWLGLDADGRTRWARLDSGAMATVQRLSLAPDGSSAAVLIESSGALAVSRRDANGDVLSPVALPTDRGTVAVAGLTHAANSDLLLAIDAWDPNTGTRHPGLVMRVVANGANGAEGATSSFELPGVIPTALAALGDGDVAVAFSYRAAVTLGGETLPASGGTNAIGLGRFGPAGEARWLRSLGFGDAQDLAGSADRLVVSFRSDENWDTPLGGIPGLEPRQSSQVVMALTGAGAPRWWRGAGPTGASAFAAAPTDGFAWVAAVPDAPSDEVVRFGPDGLPRWRLPVPGGTLIVIDGTGAVLLGTSLPAGGNLGRGALERGGAVLLRAGP
jgi:hypothetical protein